LGNQRHRHHAAASVAAVNYNLEGPIKLEVTPDKLRVLGQDRTGGDLPRLRASGKFVPLDNPANLLDVVAENCRRPDSELEAVIFGGVVAPGDHHAAVHVPMQHRKVLQRRGYDTDVNGVDTGGQQTFEQQMKQTVGR
jgi:hypothetical protein